MKPFKTVAIAISALVLLDGCAQTPMGPRVQALPAANKPFEVFQQEQMLCKQYANDQVSGQAENANERAIGATLLGGALGAGLGAAIGGGRGAGIGAAGGGVMGTAIGAGNSQKAQGGIQQQYDNAYSQCMYAKGNQIAQPVVHTVVQPVVVYPAPQVYYAPQPYYAPAPTGYMSAPPPPPPGGGYAPPSSGSGYAPPPGAGYPPPPGAASAPPPPPPDAAQ